MPMHANGRRNRKQHRFISVAYTQTDPPGGSTADRGRSLLSTIALFAIVTYVVCYFVVFVGHDRETCEKPIKPIEVPFGLWTLVGPRNHMGSWTPPQGIQISHKERALLEATFFGMPRHACGRYTRYSGRYSQESAAMWPIAAITAATWGPN